MKILILFWVLAFRVEFLLLVHPSNDTCTLKSHTTFTQILHMKRMKGKDYALNIVVASVTNLVPNYLQLPYSIHTILN
jgi:hypothetical protein